MNVKISFKHLEHTEAIDQKIRQKSEKLNKMLDGKVDIHWICEVKEGIHHAEVKLLGPSFEYHASGHTESLYKTLDVVMNKVMKQISKKKDKWKNHISHQATETPKQMALEEKLREEERVQEEIEEDNL